MSFFASILLAAIAEEISDHNPVFVNLDCQ